MQTQMLIGGQMVAGTERDEQILNPRTGELILTLPEASLAYLGAIPQDDALRRAVQKQKPVVEAAPGAPAALAFRELATRIHRWARPNTPRGHVEFFVERMLEAGGARA